MRLRPLSNDPAEAYILSKQKQQASNRVNLEFIVDRKQAEKEIDKALKYIVNKLNK